MKDYFEEAISIFPIVNGRYAPEDIFREDIERYKEYIVRQYNNDIERATDEFCFTKKIL